MVSAKGTSAILYQVPAVTENAVVSRLLWFRENMDESKECYSEGEMLQLVER